MRKYLYISCILLLTGITYSQQTGDSLFFSPIDSLKKIDTTKQTDEVNAIIEYSASDSAVFDIANHRLMLYNDGDLKYKEFELKAARIILYKDNSTLISNGIPDTANAGKLMGTPVFYEGSKKYEGTEVRYNFKTRQGNITMGTTELEGGYYLGEKIKKVSDDVYFIKDGRYTTCNKSDPDYYFGSPKMKIIQGDKVIAEPVYLYIDDVPVFAIPFGIFPNHSGRSSGIIAPSYGEDATYGRYLAHLGYFWAISDYMDLALQGNYFTKGRLDLSMRYRYALRYRFGGELDLGGSRIRLGEANDLDKVFSDDWQIGIVHNQTIDPTTSLTANVNFVSSKRYYDNSTNNLNNLLLQNAISNVTLNRSWEGTPNSISINYYRDQNLQTGEINERIPSVSFVHSQSYPFRGKNASLLDLKWYEAIAYDYNSQLLYSRAKTLKTDATTGIQNFQYNNRGGIKQNLNVSAPFKFSEFSLSPFVNYYEIWYNKSIERFYDPVSHTVITNDVPGFKAFRYFSTGVSANSRIIGIFNTDFLGVKGFRHTVTPTVTYSYQPDFSKPFWKAYGTYIDSTGKEIKYSFFEREVFGSPPTGEAQNINFSLGNVFEMKVKQDDSTDNKFQILNLNAGISYNFAADSLRLSELGLNYRTQIASLLNIGGGATFNFYKYADSVGRINKFLWNTDKRIADLTSFNINLSTTFQGNQQQATNDSAKQESEDEYIGIYEDKPPDFSIPWSVSFNYNYSISHPSPSITTKASNVSGSLMFSLTKNWKFTFSTGYDIFNKEFTAPYITIYRDLHCWEMSLNWIPTGLYRGYRFEIRIKAPQLQDVKYIKESNYRGVY